MDLRLPSLPHPYHSALGNDEIRVLHLCTPQPDEALTGQLEIVKLSQAPSYEALSYEWGSPSKTHQFRISDGSLVCITTSLFEALRDLSPGATERPRALWADSICINQDDIEERQRQVSIMGQIYRRAARVITYIGPERPLSAEAISLASRLSSLKNPPGDNPVALEQAGFPPSTDPRWRELKSLCLRSWASRCWCAQEFLSNRNLTMMCGPLVFPQWWTILNLVAQVYARRLPTLLIPSPSEDPNSIRDCLTSLFRLRLQGRRSIRDRQLLFLLRAFHPFGATDPRDKVYSLLSYSGGHKELGLRVDYGISAEQLYTTVAARLLERYQDLDLLLSNLHDKSLDLPSWVPDWSTWYFGSDLAGMGFDATHSASLDTPAEVSVDERTRTAGISGCLVGKITWVGDRILPYYVTHNGQVASQRNNWVERQLETVGKLHPYPGEPQISAVLWKTLISGATHLEELADDSYAEYFNAHVSATTEGFPAVDQKAKSFCDAVRWRSRYRCLATTENGYFGAVPQTTQVGDWVCMFHGARHLFVIRPSGANFEYVGYTYVHGLMLGQVLSAPWYKKQIITLA